MMTPREKSRHLRAHPNRHGPRVNVLVIDDSDAARATIAALLGEAGFPVFELPSAIGATRVILRNNIGAVVVDVSMPGLSGDKLVNVLRRNVSMRTLAIIVVSSDAGHLERIASDPDIDAVIAKSAIRTELIPTLERHLLAAPREPAAGTTR